MRKAKAKKSISPVEWEMLIGAWRYYEHRATITSAIFPGDIVERYFRGDYAENVCKRIAWQFVKVDHARNGEGDWIGEDGCDRKAWCRFYAFLKAYLDGWEVVRGEECFYCEATGRYYPRENYVSRPFEECYVVPEPDSKEVAEAEATADALQMSLRQTRASCRHHPVAAGEGGAE